ncbi:carbohydrate-binding protein [Mariniflexile sp. AS56]|uniref:carbohydrate-binding protein n=1 Tax=Mariniflexile sp. AS56 TaxID=3063957 RepID=UPI0026EECEC4|nr:carbohydrate-binding protein [Mariniflexile sp. AS56]MDO7171625.1 carbohydrate-binding protein [Mariniflexile sp. AS56]
MEIKTLLFTAVLSTTALFSNVFAQSVVLQSEANNGLNGATITLEDNAAKNIGFIASGDWARYDNVDLTNIAGFSTHLASNKVGDHTVTMHLDDGAGAPGVQIGSVTSNGKTGGWQTYLETENGVFTQTVTGVQTVYFVFTFGGQFNIDFFTMKDAGSLSVSDNIKEGKIGYYPNPASDALTIEMPVGYYSQYTILDVSGKVIKEEAIQSGLREVKLNVSDLSRGMYLINLKGIESKTFKFLKK